MGAVAGTLAGDPRSSDRPWIDGGNPVDADADVGADMDDVADVADAATGEGGGATVSARMASALSVGIHEGATDSRSLEVVSSTRARLRIRYSATSNSNASSAPVATGVAG